MRGATIQAFFVPLAILFMRFMAFGPVHLLVLFFDGVLAIYIQIRVLNSAAASASMSVPVANCVNICILQLLLVALCVCFTVLLNNQDRQHLLWIKKKTILIIIIKANNHNNKEENKLTNKKTSFVDRAGCETGSTKCLRTGNACGITNWQWER